MAVVGARATLERVLGRGAIGEVWLVRAADGRAFVVKFARDRGALPNLIDEGERLLGIDSSFCSRLLGVGRLHSALALDSAAGSRLFEGGTAYLVLEHREGAALDTFPPEPDPELRLRRALVIARDVGRALSDVHGAGVAHGDVKPANILFEPDSLSARLVDFGLAGAASVARASGGTRRYLAPEALEGQGRGDARLRDLYALGVTLSEVSELDPTQPAGKTADFTAESRFRRMIAALTSPAPAARPDAEWVVGRALEWLGESEPFETALARRRSRVRQTYLSTRRRELSLAATSSEVALAVDGQPARWLDEHLALLRALEALRGSELRHPPRVLGNLEGIERARWLVELVGPAAAAWPD
ncbi:MAG: protein kinase, partial [Myxococcota bacterium]|nr:protein kinase [Myxococcota bacterium]